MAPPEDLRDRARWRLGLFRERADIVLSCDLARRIDLATLGTQMTLLLTEEGTGSIALRGLPPESEIEVAATRLRPIFLQDDEVHHGKVLGALGLLAPAQEHPTIKALRGHWKDLPNSRYWSIATSRGGCQPVRPRPIARTGRSQATGSTGTSSTTIPPGGSA